MKFCHFWSPPPKIFLAIPGKPIIGSSLEKPFRRPCLPLKFRIFERQLLIHKNIPHITSDREKATQCEPRVLGRRFKHIFLIVQRKR